MYTILFSWISLSTHFIGGFFGGGIFLTPEIMNWCTLRCTRKNKLVSLPWPGYFCLPLPYFYEFLMIDKAVSTFSGWVRILTASFSSCALPGFSLPSCVITVHSAPQMFASDRLTLDALHPIRCLLTWQLWNSQHALHVKTNSTRDPCSAGRLYSLLYHTPENEPVDSRQFSMKSPQIIRSRPHRFGARKRRGMAIGLTAYLANIAGASWLYQYLSMSSWFNCLWGETITGVDCPTPIPPLSCVCSRVTLAPFPWLLHLPHPPPWVWRVRKLTHGGNKTTGVW